MESNFVVSGTQRNKILRGILVPLIRMNNGCHCAVLQRVAFKSTLLQRDRETVRGGDIGLIWVADKALSNPIRIIVPSPCSGNYHRHLSWTHTVAYCTCNDMLSRCPRATAVLRNRISTGSFSFTGCRSLGDAAGGEGRPEHDSWDFLASLGNDKASARKNEAAARNFSETPDKIKSQDIFEKLYDSILQKQDKQAPPSAPKKKLTTTLQALFQHKDKSDVELAKEDVTKMPLSMGFKTSHAVEQIRSQLASSTQRQLVSEKLAPVMEHLDALETDYDIIKYFEEKILPAFDGNSIIEPGTAVSVDAPPVTRQSLPLLLSKCISLLAKEFDSPSGAVALYELTKRRDVDVYAAGCTVEVYNAILRLRWEHYRDVYAARSVVAEMAVNAVFPDRETIEILGNIIRDSIDAKYGIVGVANLPLWTAEEEAIVEELRRYRISFTNRLTFLE